MKLALLLTLSLPLWAQNTFTLEHHDRTALRLSQAALLATMLADVLSSRGMVERNVLLGRGDFLMRRQGIRAISITSAVIVAQFLISKEWPAMRTPLKWMNYTTAIAHAGAATHNWTIK